MKKREILQFVMIWMNFDSVMLNEISQRKISTIWSHLYVDSKKKKQLIEQIGGCQNQRMEVGEVSEGGQRYKRLVIK